VAVKVLKHGLGSGPVVDRFRAEQHALAMMDHPSIARVLDAGTTGRGAPYFVMELIDGEPIAACCDRRRLTVGERVGLMRDVCLAVQHAHQKGVIHRDLKASNILVTEVDGRPVPKVIDFGIAKAVGPVEGWEALTQTRQVMGTPAAMSPEQARGDADI